jgi:uncharacterized membrane protein YdjX (TVP38/TMEM64 family)
LIFLFLIGIFFISKYFGLQNELSVKNIQNIFHTYPVWGTVIYTLFFTIGLLIYIPGIAFLVGAVYALGLVYGGIITYIAAITSCTIIFFLVRTIGGTPLSELRSEFAKKILLKVDSRPMATVIFLRLLFHTMPAINYAFALSGIKARHYVLGTCLGLPIPIFCYCYFFDIIKRFVS